MPHQQLDRCVGILVPSKDREGNDLGRDAVEGFLKICRERFLDIFPGLTDEGITTIFEKTELRGVYRAEDGSSIAEPVVLVYAYCPSSSYKSCLQQVRDLAGRLRREMNQESVAVLVFGATSMFFISDDRPK